MSHERHHWYPDKINGVKAYCFLFASDAVARPMTSLHEGKFPPKLCNSVDDSSVRHPKNPIFLHFLKRASIWGNYKGRDVWSLQSSRKGPAVGKNLMQNKQKSAFPALTRVKPANQWNNKYVNSDCKCSEEKLRERKALPHPDIRSFLEATSVRIGF